MRLVVPLARLARIAASIASVVNYAEDTGNTAGKLTNRGFEGLAISPDGDTVFAMLQCARLDEGSGDGSVNRMVAFQHPRRQCEGTVRLSHGGQFARPWHLRARGDR
ncbi:esterase-like activity of phytase family protein [Variovorax sp. J22R24]|nr:esterase-like activity of phytase family protein [Variovorax sp. J22R24]MDM0110454.1 esterase-like activity of phytase family protein [Variovorax sp. J22R24]